MTELLSDSPRRRLAARVARWFTAILLLAMFIGTHLPAHSLPGFTLGDKVIHAAAYFALTLSALTSWELSVGVLRPPHYFAVWLACTLYGALDEITQTPFGRSCDGLDWLSDIVGIVAGLLCFRLLRGLWARLLSPAVSQ